MGIGGNKAGVGGGGGGGGGRGRPAVAEEGDAVVIITDIIDI
jgi:hypothetical protein